MLTLFLDFGSSTHSMVLIQDETTIATKTIEPRTDETALPAMINELLASQKLTTAKLTRIACVIGPGGFMSLRVGVSLANALAWGLKIPLAGVHLSDLWAMRCSQASNLKPQTFLWLHSTKKEMAFVRRFGILAKKWSEPTLLTIDELKKQILEETPYVGELIDEQKTRLPQLKPMTNLLPIADVLPEILKTLSYGQAQLMPWYGRNG